MFQLLSFLFFLRATSSKATPTTNAMTIQVGNSGTVGEGDEVRVCVVDCVGVGVGVEVTVGTIPIVTCMGAVCILYVDPVSPTIL